jgi:hypothetical protein
MQSSELVKINHISMYTTSFIARHVSGYFPFFGRMTKCLFKKNKKEDIYRGKNRIRL